MASHLFLQGTAARDFLPSYPVKFSTFFTLLLIGLPGMASPLFLKGIAARVFLPYHPIYSSTFIISVILLPLYCQWIASSLFLRGTVAWDFFTIPSYLIRNFHLHHHFSLLDLPSIASPPFLQGQQQEMFYLPIICGKMMKNLVLNFHLSHHSRLLFLPSIASSLLLKVTKGIFTIPSYLERWCRI